MAQEQRQQQVRPEMPMELRERLITAIEKHDIPTVREILDRGMDLNFQHGGLNYTPLITACSRASIFDRPLKICEMLLTKGANPNMQGGLGKSPLKIVCDKDSPTNTAIANLLIDHGATIDTEDVFHSTALHYACYRGAVAMVQWLLDHGASINDPFHSGYTALESAAIRKQREVIKILVKINPDIDVNALRVPPTGRTMIQEELNIYNAERKTKRALHEDEKRADDLDDATQKKVITAEEDDVDALLP